MNTYFGSGRIVILWGLIPMFIARESGPEMVSKQKLSVLSTTPTDLESQKTEFGVYSKCDVGASENAV